MLGFPLKYWIYIDSQECILSGSMNANVWWLSWFAAKLCTSNIFDFGHYFVWRKLHSHSRIIWAWFWFVEFPLWIEPHFVLIEYLRIYLYRNIHWFFEASLLIMTLLQSLNTKLPRCGKPKRYECNKFINHTQLMILSVCFNTHNQIITNKPWSNNSPNMTT